MKEGGGVYESLVRMAPSARHKPQSEPHAPSQLVPPSPIRVKLTESPSASFSHDKPDPPPAEALVNHSGGRRSLRTVAGPVGSGGHIL
jgi:hypothetical protein